MLPPVPDETLAVVDETLVVVPPDVVVDPPAPFVVAEPPHAESKSNPSHAPRDSRRPSVIVSAFREVMVHATMHARTARAVQGRATVFERGRRLARTRGSGARPSAYSSLPDTPMDLLADLPMPSLDGPTPLPLVGRHANVLRFFRDPVGRLTDLHARYGDIVAFSKGDATWVALRGAARLRQVLGDASAFHNLADSPVPVPRGSAPDILFGRALTALNGDAHRRARRLMQPIFTKTAVATYHEEVVGTVDRMVGAWSRGSHDVSELRDGARARSQ